MKHLSRKLALLGALGVAMAAVSYAPPATAQLSVGVGIRLGPPPPRFEPLPPPRVGLVWAPGYWRWDPRVRRHVWVRGYWVRARYGYRYRPAYWVRGRHNWHFHPGYWAR